MADYYPLISRAVAGLERNTGENRRSLYERARNALLDQLRSVTPSLSETDITRERLALEEAIRKVESDVARRMREEIPRPSERAAPRPKPPQDSAPPASPPTGSPPPTGEDEPPPPPLESRPAFGRIVGRPEVTAADLRRFQRRPPLSENKPSDPTTSEPAQALAPVQAELAPGSTALAEPPEAPESPPESEPDTAAPVEVKERKSLRFPVFGLAARKRPEPAPSETEPAPLSPDHEVESQEAQESHEQAGRELAATRALEPPLMMDGARPRPVTLRRPAAAAKKVEGGGALKRLLNSSIGTVVVAALVICVVGGALFWQRNAIKAGFASIFSLAHGPAATQASHDNTPARSKIPDRVGQSASSPSAEQSRSTQAAPAAQRVVLYEEDPSDTNGSGKHYDGTVTWSLENIAAGPGQPMDKAIRGDIVIPERNMTATFTIRRNTDKDLPASHTVSIVFTLPPDFVHGAIQEIRALLMKQTEPARGVQLAGLSVKVTNGFFLIGLSSNEGDVQRNIQLLKERGWFDIAIGYTDNRRAIMAVEKGPQGDRVFADAFAAWGQ